MRKLPVLISMPHGGNRVPDNLHDLVALAESDLFDDSDPFTREIFNLENDVAKVISTDIYRAIVDMNRSQDDIPPKNPDGVVKTRTCYGKQVYKNEKGLNAFQINSILQRFYNPYHKNIQQALRCHEIKLALDCHSMAEVGSEISPDRDVERPDICLSNVNGESCNFDTIERLADCMRKAFSTDSIEINKPFTGGYVTQTYGMKTVPCIQVELNRKLYLDESLIDKSMQKIDNKKLNKLMINSITSFMN